jgi:hypothetical protein
VADSAPSYRRLFWKSRHHLWLALVTLGLGFASGEPLGLLAGATLYALGLVFLPDFRSFKRGVDDRLAATRAAEHAARLAEFRSQQEQLLRTLSALRRQRHQQLAAVCKDIEDASAEGQAATGLEVQSGFHKLEELKWTYLRMLTIEQSLDVYLEAERRENVPALAASLEAETQVLAADVERTKGAAPAAGQDTRQRLLASHLERLAALRQRLHRIEQAQANLSLVRSEQERLVEQVKLIRADAVAAKNADALSARIDLSIAHLAATNQWLSELSEFKDLTQQMPDPMPGASKTSTTGSPLTIRRKLTKTDQS